MNVFLIHIIYNNTMYNTMLKIHVSYIADFLLVFFGTQKMENEKHRGRNLYWISLREGGEFQI